MKGPLHKIERLGETIGSKYIVGDQNAFTKIKSLDSKKLIEKVRLIYWAIMGVQTELGLLLISLESYKKFQQCQDNNSSLLSYMTFVHHHFLCIECLYRVWERFSQVIYYIHTHDDKKAGYYNTIIQELSESKKYNIDRISEFKKHQKHWDKIAKDRNYYSHEYSNLTDGMRFDISISPILNIHEIPIIKAREVQRDLKHDFHLIKQQYKYLIKLDITFYTFILNITQKSGPL